VVKTKSRNAGNNSETTETGSRMGGSRTEEGTTTPVPEHLTRQKKEKSVGAQNENLDQDPTEISCGRHEHRRKTKGAWRLIRMDCGKRDHGAGWQSWPRVRALAGTLAGAAQRMDQRETNYTSTPPKRKSLERKSGCGGSGLSPNRDRDRKYQQRKQTLVHTTPKANELRTENCSEQTKN
jgi:hypothetical protein